MITVKLDDVTTANKCHNINDMPIFADIVYDLMKSALEPRVTPEGKEILQGGTCWMLQLK